MTGDPQPPTEQTDIAKDRGGKVRVHAMTLVLVLLLIIAIATTVAAVQLVQIKCGLGGSEA